MLELPLTASIIFSNFSLQFFFDFSIKNYLDEIKQITEIFI